MPIVYAPSLVPQSQLRFLAARLDTCVLTALCADTVLQPVRSGIIEHRSHDSLNTSCITLDIRSFHNAEDSERQLRRSRPYMFD